MSVKNHEVVLAMLIFCVIPSPFSVRAQGTVEVDSFYSESLQQMRRVSIYLPEGYDDHPELTYPAVYFLHGFGSDHLGYSGMYSSLDIMMASGEIMKMIVVKPGGDCQPYGGSFYTNSILNGKHEDYVARDLVNYVDSSFRTKPIREYRAISGHSMGGYGTMKMAMKHSEMFSSCAAHSGPIDFENLMSSFLRQLVVWENAGRNFDPDNGSLTHMMFAMAAAFSPDLGNPPYLVDLPIDREGDVVDSVFTRWLQHDPYSMIDLYSSSLRDLNIYFDCGVWDELFLYSHAVDFSERLTQSGISHIFESYSGDHTSKIYERLKVSFHFHSNHFADGPPYSLGDVTRDSAIDILDVMRVVNIILEVGDSPSEYELWSADMDRDGVVNVLDAVGIVRIILGGRD